MSTEVLPKGHRHTRSAAIPSSPALSQNPQNPHHLNSHTYAQNNQIDSNMNSSVRQVTPTTPPRTPRRDRQPIPPNAANTTTEPNSKQRSRNKNRAKSGVASPATTRNDQKTPPLTQNSGMPSAVKQINTPSTQAYAGATFTASPAPSALPIPSFYSKSVPDSPGLKGLQSLKDNPLSSHLATPPLATPPIKELQREESPLDFFFKADREEKARARSASSSQNTTAVNGPFAPPAVSPRSSQTPPAMGGRVPGHSVRNSASGMFAMELDGVSEVGTPLGPAFSTPYSERIQAARSGTNSTRAPHRPSNPAQQSYDKAEALKAYLFSSHISPTSPPVESIRPTQSASPLARNLGNEYQQYPTFDGPRGPRAENFSYASISDPRTVNSRLSGRSSGLRQEVTPTKTPTKTPDHSDQYGNSSTPSRFPGNISNIHGVTGSSTNSTSSIPNSSYNDSMGERSANIRGMEDTLRKILKLDSGSGSGSSMFGTGNLPAANESVPTYIGGGPSSVNGMNNGSMRS